MKILFTLSEAAPFIKTGGLADVTGSLPFALKNKGINVAVIMPLYKKIKEKYSESLEYLGNKYIDLSWRRLYAGVFKIDYNGVPFFFIDNEYYFERDNCYGEPDDGERFAFFSKAVLEVLDIINFIPDIIHLHDWQCALIPLLLKDTYAESNIHKSIKTVFTIHNIEYQGICHNDFAGDVLGISENMRSYLSKDNNVNFMKSALYLADKITTVSNTYSYEIRNDYYSHGLTYDINQNAYKLSGITNGIDTAYYNPETDNNIYVNYSKNTIDKKSENKLALQKELNLPINADIPMIAIVSRLAGHKGIDLLKYIFDELMRSDAQFVLLGTGEREYENFFRRASYKYPGKVSANIKFEPALSSKIYAASDIYLMPSKAEPCGLSQLIAMRYGSVPVVRETGGLVDTVLPCNFNEKSGNGFTFKTYNAHDLLDAIWRAVGAYTNNKREWRELICRNMSLDMSWSRSADKYIELYSKILK